MEDLGEHKGNSRCSALHIGGAQQILAPLGLSSHPTALLQVSAPFPHAPPPSGSGRKQYRRKCSAHYGGVAFYSSVAGFRGPLTFTSLAVRPAHSAFRQCGRSRRGGAGGLGVSGGKLSSRCWLGLVPWMWANF